MIGKVTDYDEEEQILTLVLEADELDLAAAETGLLRKSFQRKFQASRWYDDGRLNVTVRGPRGEWLQRYIDRRDKGHQAEREATRTMIAWETRRRADDHALIEIRDDVLALVQVGDLRRMEVRKAIDVYIELHVVGWWPIPDLRFVEPQWWNETTERLVDPEDHA